VEGEKEYMQQVFIVKLSYMYGMASFMTKFHLFWHCRRKNQIRPDYKQQIKLTLSTWKLCSKYSSLSEWQQYLLRTSWWHYIYFLNWWKSEAKVGHS